MENDQDPVMRMFLMAGTISDILKDKLKGNAIVADDDARWAVSEWLAGYLDAQIKVAISETKRKAAKLTDEEKAVIQKGIFLYRSAMMEFYKENAAKLGIPDKSKEESAAIHDLDKKVWSL
jgi:hypothetical protein